MANDLNTFEKKHDYLICVDSDGCAMNTMDVKHYRCFGPCMVDEWGLDKWRESILNRWNEVNLYTMTRGVNRFKALAICLSEINEQYAVIEDLASLTLWVETSPELSNVALKAAVASAPSLCLEKALRWSIAVNEAITALPDETKLPFPMAKEALAFAHERADVAIVSSANLDAVLAEWQEHGLLEHTDIVLSQNAGSKAFCIGELLQKGYTPEHVLMCGDAPGDCDATQKNGVFFYPILVRNEKASWEEFIAEGFERLLSGVYAGDYQTKKTAQFFKNLGA